VVEAVGVTVLVVVPVTVPIPWSMVRVVALLVCQARVTAVPEVTVVGVAVKEEIVGSVAGGGGVWVVEIPATVIIPAPGIVAVTFCPALTVTLESVVVTSLTV
jgi:hypothetical protein